MKSPSVLLFAPFLFACSAPATPAPAAAPVAQVAPQLAPPLRAEDVVALVDHHQHLLSPAAAQASSDPRFVPVALPAPLDSLLQARIRASTNRAALEALYTKEAWLLQSFGPGWVRGGAEVASWWAGNTNEPYHLVPVGHGVTGSSGYIATYLLDTPADSEPAAHVLIGVGRDTGGRWRITSEALTMGGQRIRRPVMADQLVALLDSAGIRRAAVLSVAYQWGSPARGGPEEQARTRAENDWVAEQVARHPDRLVAFCSFNFLKPYALEELERCAASGKFRGIKLHAGNADMNWGDAGRVDKLRAVFAAANARGLAIVIHSAPRGSANGRGVGEAILERLLPAAPDVPVQLAHLASPGHLDARSDSALAPLAEAASAGDPRTRNLWFDVTTVAHAGITAENARLVVERLRQVGMGRVLYGTDMAGDGNVPPREAWTLLRTKLPLTVEELRTIATNVAPYMR
jgi:uncharacterized protein